VVRGGGGGGGGDGDGPQAGGGGREARPVLEGQVRGPEPSPWRREEDEGVQLYLESHVDGGGKDSGEPRERGCWVWSVFWGHAGADT